MRIGIVVPREIVNEIISFLRKEFPEMEAIPFPYDSIMDIPDNLSGKQNRVDSFLFLGDTARRYAEKAIPHASEWLTIPRSSSALLRLLFRAEVAGFPMHIATDLNNEKFFLQAFHEIGFHRKKLPWKSSTCPPTAKAFLSRQPTRWKSSIDRENQFLHHHVLQD